MRTKLLSIHSPMSDLSAVAQPVRRSSQSVGAREGGGDIRGIQIDFATIRSAASLESLVGQISCVNSCGTSFAKVQKAREGADCAKIAIRERNQGRIGRSAFDCKYCLRFSENYDLRKPSRDDIEGRFGQSSRNVGRGMQWTPGCRARDASRGRTAPGGRRNRVVLAPLGWR
jgi:hypothetical protein